jgi:hypothetical protein
MLKHAWKVLVAGAVVSLGACGGDGGGGPSFSDSVSTTEAADFADDATQISSQIAYAMNANGPSVGLAAPAMAQRLLARGALAALPARVKARIAAVPAIDWRNPGPATGLMASSSVGCTVTAHGTLEGLDGYVDANENGIADDLYVKVDCTETEEGVGDTVYTYQSVWTESWKEITGSLYGFNYATGFSYKTSDNHGNTWEAFTFDASEKVDIRASSVAHAVRYDIRGWDEIDGELDEGTGGQSWSANFDPDSPIPTGGPLPDGDLSFAGRDYYTETDGRNLSFAIETTTPLAYSAACFAVPTNPPFTAGVILGQLNNSGSQASFEITFTNCGGFGITYEGTVDLT